MEPHELVAALIRKTGKSTLQVAIEMDRASFQGTLHKYINGGVRSPSHTTAKKIADYFGLNIEALYDRAHAAKAAKDHDVDIVVWDGKSGQTTTFIQAKESSAEYRISRHFNKRTRERIEALDDHQFHALESVIQSYLDAIQAAAPRKAHRA